MYRVYQAADLTEAELLLQRLSDRGIPARVRNRFLQGALGELPLSVRPEVCVLEERDVSAARLCVDEMEQALRSPTGPDVKCGRCGEDNPSNFEVCWKCRADLDP